VSDQVEVLVSSMQKTNEWLRDIAAELGEGNRHHAYAALRATLHALRDRLSVEQTAHLAAQLPLVVRGIYFEGWNPVQTSSRVRTRDDFLEVVRAHLRATTPLLREHCEDVVLGCLRVVARHLDGSALHKLREALPKELRELWPMYV
jgi:uncharacterized protein (DUF2267 family)